MDALDLVSPTYVCRGYACADQVIKKATPSAAYCGQRDGMVAPLCASLGGYLLPSAQDLGQFLRLNSLPECAVTCAHGFSEITHPARVLQGSRDRSVNSGLAVAHEGLSECTTGSIEGVNDLGSR